MRSIRPSPSRASRRESALLCGVPGPLADKGRPGVALGTLAAVGAEPGVRLTLACRQERERRGKRGLKASWPWHAGTRSGNELDLHPPVRSPILRRLRGIFRTHRGGQHTRRVNAVGHETFLGVRLRRIGALVFKVRARRLDAVPSWTERDIMSVRGPDDKMSLIGHGGNPQRLSGPQNISLTISAGLS